MKQLPFLNHAADQRFAGDPSTSAANSAANSAAATESDAGQQRPAIIVPVQATTAGEIARQCRAIAATGLIDVIEWRIDPIVAGAARTADWEGTAEVVLDLAENVTVAGLPVLITLRTAFEGGSAEVSEDAYTEILETIISGLSGLSGLSGPTGLQGAGRGAVALDVEIERRGAAALIGSAHARGISAVASHHNFAETASAEAMATAFAKMAAAGADVAKIAMMPQTRADVAALLRATAQADATLDVPVLGISMGQLGRTSRIMGADFGSCASFAQLGDSSAPGQIAVADLAGIFDRLYG